MSSEGPQGGDPTGEPCASDATKLALIREVAGLGFWEHDFATGRTWADSRVEAIYGYPEGGSGLGADYQVWLRHVHPEDRDWVEARFRAVFGQQASWDLTYRIVLAGGAVRHVRSKGRLERDAGGAPWRFVGFEEDISDRVEREQALRDANERLEQAESIARIGHWVCYPEIGTLIWSPMTFELCGFDPQAPTPDFEAFLERIPEEDRAQVAEFQFQRDPDRDVADGRYRIRHPNGETLWVRDVAHQWRDEDGNWVVQGTLQDITAYKETLDAAQERRHELEAIFQSAASVSLIKTSPEGIVEEASRGAERLFGYAREELIGQPLTVLYPETGGSRAMADLERLREDKRDFTEETRLVRRSGEVFPVLLNLVPIFDDAGEVVSALAACMDISERVALEEELRRQALRDGLTGAFNRRHMELLLNKEQERARRYGQALTALLIDVDRFKQLNDRHGHEAGDEVLRELVRACFRTQLRTADHLGRWGGEEFLILLPETEEEGALEVAERIRERVASMDLRAGSVTVSIGTAGYRSGESVREWIGRADAALYAAKDAGRNRVEAYTEAHQGRLV